MTRASKDTLCLFRVKFIYFEILLFVSYYKIILYISQGFQIWLPCIGLLISEFKPYFDGKRIADRGVQKWSCLCIPHLGMGNYVN